MIRRTRRSPYSRARARSPHPPSSYTTSRNMTQEIELFEKLIFNDLLRVFHEEKKIGL